MKSCFRPERSLLLLPVCAAAVLCLAGCSNQSELLVPEGAFTPENTAPIPADNASPSPGIGVQRPAGSTSIGGTTTVDDVLDIQPVQTPAPVVKETPKAPAVSVRRPPVVKPVAGDVVYKVKKGDTLGAIAKRYRIHWRAIAEYNGIDSKGRIFVGQSLRIPAAAKNAKAAPAKKAAGKSVQSAKDTGKIHIVKKGEYPGKIAAMYKVKVADLLALNNIKGKKTIYPGQKLRIPGAAAVTAKNVKKDSKKAPGKTARKTVAKKKDSAAKKVVKNVQKKEPAVPVVDRSEKKTTGDDVLNKLDNDKQTPAATNTKTNVTVDADKQKEVAQDTPTLEMKLDKDMTLEQVSKAFDRSIDTLKKYNPNLASGEVLKAGTMITVPIF